MRSSWTFFESGSVVITAVAAIRGLGWTRRYDSLIVLAPGAGRILTSGSRASTVKRTNGARRVSGGALQSRVSISTAVSTQGGAAC